MRAIASETRVGCRVRKSKRSRFVTLSVFRYSRTESRETITAANPKLQRQATSARPRDGWRNISSNPCSVGERRDMRLRSYRKQRTLPACYWSHNHWRSAAPQLLAIDRVQANVSCRTGIRRKLCDEAYGLEFYCCQEPCWRSARD